MTVTAPPRRPRRGEPLEREEIEALVEALIEEARQRAQRRRRRNGAIVTLVALVGVALFALLGRSASSQTAFPALSARSSLPAGAANSKIAYTQSAAGGGLYVVNPDGSGKRRLTRFAVMHGAPPPVWSPDGQKIAFMSAPGASEEITVISADGSRKRILTHHPASDQGPVWSPDGRKIAFTRASYSAPVNPTVYVMNADGSGQRKLAHGMGPVWSPDGQKIAYGNHPSGNGVHVVSADGSGQRKLTRGSSSPFGDVPVGWSPDGKKILFVRAVGRDEVGRSPARVDLYFMNPDGSGQRRLRRNAGGGVWSPDGRKIAFGSVRDGNHGVYVMNADGSGTRRLTDNGDQPVWSPDGRMIAFQSGRDGFAAISVMNADGSGVRRIARLETFEVQLAWSPALKK